MALWNRTTYGLGIFKRMSNFSTADQTYTDLVHLAGDDGNELVGSTGDAAYAGANVVADKPSLMGLLAGVWSYLKSLAGLIQAGALKVTLVGTDANVTLNVDDLSGVALNAAENHIGAVGGHVALISVSFARPADTTAYALGDLVANSTVANAVTPMVFAISRAAGKGGMIRRARLRKTGTSLVNASFRLHLYKASPVQSGGAGASTGDNAAWLTDNAANYVGSIDVTFDKAFTDGASGNGVPNTGAEINFRADTYYGLLEARGAYAPLSAETFTAELEVLQN